MKDFWKFGSWLLVVLVMLFLGGCLGHEANTTGAVSKKDIALDLDSGGGILYVHAPTYISTYNSQSAIQKTDNDPSSAFDANVGLNGGAASQAKDGGKAVSEGLATLNQLMQLGEEKQVPPSVAPPTVIVPPAVSPESPAGGTTENGLYWGRHNDDRATWYFDKNMTAYPDIVYLTVDGCVSGIKVKTTEVDDKGNPRFVIDGYVIKQSDVSGRAMAVVAPSSCLSEKASIAY